MNRLFQQKEKYAVEEKFANNIVFSTMRNAAIRLYNQNRDTALNAPELFYQVFCTLDTIKSKPIIAAQRYCSHDLWDELIDYLFNERDTDNQSVIRENATAIMAVSAIILIWSNDPTFASISSALLLNPEHEMPDYTKTILNQFRLSFRDADQESLSKYISEYMHSEEILSEELNELLDSLPVDDEKVENNTSTHDPDIRLAEGKITSFIFAIEAMHSAGWFTNAESKPIRSKDKVIKAFLQRVLGVDNPNISQLRSSAKNRNKIKPHEYLQELVDILK